MKMCNPATVTIAGLCLLNAGLAGCSGNQTNEATTEVKMEFDSIATNTVVGINIGLETVGDTLIVTDYQGDSLLHFLSLSDGSLIAKAAAVGSGPGEVNRPIDMQIVDGRMTIFDKQKQILYESPLSSKLQMTKLTELPYSVSQIFRLDSQRIFTSLCLFSADVEEVYKNRFIIFSPQGEIMAAFGSYPKMNPKDNELTIDVLSRLHQTHGLCEIDDSHFAATTYNILSIYRKLPDGTYEVENETLIEPYDYTYTPGNQMMSAMVNLSKDCARTGVGILHIDGKLVFPMVWPQGVRTTLMCADTKGKILMQLVPDVELEDPVTIDDDGHVIGLSNNGDYTQIVRSKKTLAELIGNN